MAKYFVNPFGVSGDRTVIPEPVQPDGSVSYTSGFGVDYELDPLLSPAALDVPRNKTNELFYEITLAVQQYQQTGNPTFITTGDNLGSPYPYGKNAIVTYDDGLNGVRVFRSLITSNTNLPTVSSAWQVLSFFIQGAATGTANALTLNAAVNYPTLLPGDTVELTILSNNTGPATLKIGTGPIIPINKSTLSGLQQLDGNEQLQQGIYTYKYNGTVWVLTNPSISATAQVVTSWNGSVSPVNVIADTGMDISSGTIRNKIVYARVRSTVNVDFSSGTTVIPFNNVVSDVYGWWNGTTNRFTPNVSGLFRINVCATFDIPSTDLIRVNIFKNSSLYQIIGEYSFPSLSLATVTIGAPSTIISVTPGDFFNISIVALGSIFPITMHGGTGEAFFEIEFLGKP